MTKQEIIEEAFSALGLSDYVFNLQPEEFTTALNRLNSMMNDWAIQSIRLGYNISKDANDEMGTPDIADEAIITNLAIRLASSMGKTVPLEVRDIANRSYTNILSYCMRPEQLKYNNLLAGAGNKVGSNRSVFIPNTKESIDNGKDSTLEY